MSSSPSPTVKQLVKINWLLSVVTTSSRLLLCHTFILDPKSAPTAPALHCQMLLEVLSVVLWQIISNSCMSHWSRNPEKNPHAHLMHELHVNNHRLQPLCVLWQGSLCAGHTAEALKWRHRFQQNYGPKTWSAKHWFFILVEHPAPISMLAYSRAMQTQEFCSTKNQRIPAKPSQQRNVTTKPRKQPGESQAFFRLTPSWLPPGRSTCFGACCKLELID